MVIAMSLSCATNRPSGRPEIPLPPLRADPLKLPAIARTPLPNGLTVVTVTRRDLPLVAVRLVVGTGSARDPAGKEGLAQFTGQLLRRGTVARTAEQVDDAIESIGGLLGVEVGPEATMLGVTVPSEQAQRAVDVIADLVRNAVFPEREVDLARRRELAQLRQDLDDPSNVADKALLRFIYGKSHPYGHPSEGTTASVSTFVRDDARSFRDATYTPQGALLLFAGDVDAEAALGIARQYLGEWNGPPPTTGVVPPAPEPQGLQILLVDKSDATQAQVRASVPGLARRDPRYAAATVANTVVGGGFTSRLVDEVRVNRGLSYSAGTRLAALRDVGAITFSSFTKTETVRELLDVTLHVLDGFAANGPTADEVDKARRYMAGLYPSRVESVESLCEALARAWVNGLPFESVAEYRAQVVGTTPEAAAKTAGLWPTSSRAKVVVVGAAERIRPQIETLGAVTTAKVDEFE